ncbi:MULTISPECIES: diaminobutyrate acetyltransferase [unclassified Rhodococcus (in: high G+C Gram-positive bacteria)]|uniref:diaminobutyrate acetyltransferase n=1 Tax=unclassified Rhodococcus (in: high G+C Gram-positive bacteria) TaxID=192944 RepID=UPI0033937013
MNRSSSHVAPQRSVAILRNVTPNDASAIFRIARTVELDMNSHYIYTLWCRDYSEYTAIALDDNGGVLGFIMCYPRPSDPDHLFIWQAGIIPEARGLGLAVALLHHVFSGKFSYVECTITPNNSASLRFLQKFADQVGAPLKISLFLSEEDLGGSGHEREDLVSIGAIPAMASQPVTS